MLTIDFGTETKIVFPKVSGGAFFAHEWQLDMFRSLVSSEVGLISEPPGTLIAVDVMAFCSYFKGNFLI